MEAAMDKDLMGIIAVALVKLQFFRNGLPGVKEFREGLAETSKAIDIDEEALVNFYEALLPDVLRPMLGRKSVELTTSD